MGKRWNQMEKEMKNVKREIKRRQKRKLPSNSNFSQIFIDFHLKLDELNK